MVYNTSRALTLAKGIRAVSLKPYETNDEFLKPLETNEEVFAPTCGVCFYRAS